MYAMNNDHETDRRVSHSSNSNSILLAVLQTLRSQEGAKHMSVYSGNKWVLLQSKTEIGRETCRIKEFNKRWNYLHLKNLCLMGL